MNLVSCFRTSHLIILSHPLHPSPESTWTRLIVWILDWQCHLIIFLFNPRYPSTGRTSAYSIVWISHNIWPFYPPHPSPDRTWTYSTIWRLVISLFYLTLFTRLQGVRELAQLFELPLSRSSYTIFLIRSPELDHVWILVSWLSHPVFLIRLQSVRELFEIVLRLLISSYSLQPSKVCDLGQIIWIPIIWSIYPIVFIRL